MAYFRKRGKTWSFTIDGKEKGGFRTKKDAEMAATKMQLEIDTGMYIQPSEITFKDYAENVWLPVYSRSAKESTIYIRKNNLRALFELFGPETKLKDITHIAFEKRMLDVFDNRARNTALSICVTAKMILKKAIKDSVIKNNPAEHFKVPREKMTIEQAELDELPRYLEKEELAKFLNVAHKNGEFEDFLTFRILAYTGMRIGELCALKWSDIDLKKGEININKTYFNEKHSPKEYILTTPKTKASRRKIDIDTDTIALLKKHKLQQQLIKRGCENWHDGDFVITHFSVAGYPITQTLAWGKMKRFLKLANLPQNLTPHSLRHTHCSLLAEAGASLEEIQSRLGQTDEGTTRRVYLHITQARKKETLQKFTKLMQGIF